MFSPTAALAAPPPFTVSFSPGAEQTFVVPAGVTELQVVASGGRGGANASNNGLGGYGARLAATIVVTPAQTLYVAVGGNGGAGPGGPTGTTSSGGTAGNQHNTGGGGGGASVVSTCSGADPSCTTTYYGGTEPRLLVAAGGGGGGGYDGCNGGNGAGGVTGRGGTSACGGGGNGGAGVGGEGNYLVSCAPPLNRGGKGGTLVGPGAGGLSSTGNVGRPGVGPRGGNGYLTATGDGFGGGGGGGYYGGGGGGATNNCAAYGFGGGAGSSYAVPGATSFALGDDTTATPRIAITYTRLPSAITTQASAPIVLGAGSISDSATVTVTSGVPPTGTVTFDVFGPDDATCSGPPVDSSTIPITAGDAASTPFIPTTAGVYLFVASYSGDADNAPSTGACNDANEATAVSPATSGLTTQAAAPIVLGAGSISDTATVTVTSGVPPTGTVTFDVFGPDDATCAGPPVDSSTSPITAGDATSTPFTPTAGGVYRFVASYSGDVNNLPTSGQCNDLNEATTVNPVPSAVTTQASAPIVLGAGSISDSATVTITSGVPPTGTVTFDVFGPDDATCSGTPVTSSTNALTAADAASTPFLPTAAGVYRFVASYSGDSNNAPVAGACNDANESTTVTAPPPAVAPIAPGPTLSISPSPSRPPSRDALRLTTDTTDITPGQAGRLHVTGTTGQAVQLLCYSRPSTTYVQARPAQPGQGIVISDGAVDFSVLPGRNTRCFVQYLDDAGSQSNSVVINVHTELSLSVHRDGVQGYHFQGTNLPRVGDQLITLYRIDRNGNEIRTATTRTDASGTWRIDRVFTGSGPFRFVARSGQTLNNAAGKSNVLQVTLH